jgi:hypothetical protein
MKTGCTMFVTNGTVNTMNALRLYSIALMPFPLYDHGVMLPA